MKREPYHILLVSVVVTRSIGVTSFRYWVIKCCISSIIVTIIVLVLFILRSQSIWWLVFLQSTPLVVVIVLRPFLTIS